MDKALKSLIRELEAQGWDMRETKKGFYAVPPDADQPMVMIHMTPSDRRAWDNMMSRLKRSGFRQKG